MVAEPEMGVRYLADYMAGSERKKRSVLVEAKYRRRARLPQHREAKAVIASALIKGNGNKAFLHERAVFIRNKLATDDFDAFINETNADYVERFSQVVGELDLPGVEFLPGKTYSLGKINGLKVPFGTNLSLRRTTKSNKMTAGAVMFRYAKGKNLSAETAAYQSAAILGFLRQLPSEDGVEIDPALCITLDGHSAIPHRAPSKAITMFKNTLAACETIADAWPNVKPPKGAFI
jgi:hypothetical protein